MKGFIRKNQLLSLCGLNCGLCPMFLSKHCGGCGHKNQSCSIARCSLEHNCIEYCFECNKYPCDKYENIDAYDSFITHKNQKLNLLKAQKMSIDEYNNEQKEKIKILDDLLSHYNDGRRKTFFCVTVNLLELTELKEGLQEIYKNNELSSLSKKEVSEYVVKVFQRIADKRNIKLKLVKRKNE